MNEVERGGEDCDEVCLLKGIGDPSDVTNSPGNWLVGLRERSEGNVTGMLKGLFLGNLKKSRLSSSDFGGILQTGETARRRQKGEYPSDKKVPLGDLIKEKDELTSGERKKPAWGGVVIGRLRRASILLRKD